MKRGGVVVSTLDYGSWGREFKSKRVLELPNGRIRVDSALTEYT